MECTCFLSIHLITGSSRILRHSLYVYYLWIYFLRGRLLFAPLSQILYLATPLFNFKVMLFFTFRKNWKLRLQLAYYECNLCRFKLKLKLHSNAAILLIFHRTSLQDLWMRRCYASSKNDHWKHYCLKRFSHLKVFIILQIAYTVLKKRV